MKDLRPCPGCHACQPEYFGQNYGFFPGGDPRLFTPDPECSTNEERQLHAAHCAAWERGERPAVAVSGIEVLPSFTRPDGTFCAGGRLGFVERASYGLGSYDMISDDSCDGSGVLAARGKGKEPK